MYYKVKYTDKIKNNRAECVNWGWHIKILPKYKGDVSVLKHGLQHVRQFWNHPFTHALWYKYSKRYRLQCEVEAYSEQLRWPPACDDTMYYRGCFARFISTTYNLNITEDKAYGLLL